MPYRKRDRNEKKGTPPVHVEKENEKGIPSSRSSSQGRVVPCNMKRKKKHEPYVFPCPPHVEKENEEGFPSSRSSSQNRLLPCNTKSKKKYTN
jgi:hypothetical protein